MDSRPLAHGLGWIPEAAASRKRLYASARRFSPGPEVPRRTEPLGVRDWMVIHDQGQIGSCGGNSRASVNEVCNWIDTRGSVIQLSRMFAYLTAQQVDNLLGRDAGCTISGCAKAARDTGVCLESTMPYPDPVRYHTQIPQAARAEASQHKLQRHSVLRSYQEVLDWITTGQGGVQIGIAWVESLANNKTGVIESVGGRNYGGHALALLDISTRKDSSGRPYIEMYNSHGLQWGDRGVAAVSPAIIDRWCREQMSEVIGFSDLEEFSVGRLDWLSGPNI